MLDHQNIEQFTGFNKVKYDMVNPAMSFDIEYQKLTLMCGHNGVGKSFTNKLTWLANFFFNLKLIEMNTGHKLNEAMSDEELLEFVIDNTFDDADFDGKVRYYSTEAITEVPHYIFEFEFVNGKPKDVYIDYPKNAKPSGTPMYMSKETRQFSYLDRYITMKELLGVKSFETFDDLHKLTDHFRLYDIFAVETLINKLPYINYVIESVNKVTKELFEGLDIESMGYNPERKAITFTDSLGVEKKITTLGDGHQAILIMMLGVVVIPEEAFGGVEANQDANQDTCKPKS